MAVAASDTLTKLRSSRFFRKFQVKRVAKGRLFTFSKSTVRHRHSSRQVQRSEVQIRSMFALAGNKPSGRQTHLSSRAHLDIAFAPQNRISAVASEYGVSPTTVKRSRVCVAQSILVKNVENLKELLKLVEAEPAIAAFDLTVWDEAKSKVKVLMSLSSYRLFHKDKKRDQYL